MKVSYKNLVVGRCLCSSKVFVTFIQDMAWRHISANAYVESMTTYKGKNVIKIFGAIYKKPIKT